MYRQSTIRSWLNGYGASSNTVGDDYTSKNFINTAFTDEEKAKLIASTVHADKNPNFDTDPGNATTDKIFLLSYVEVTDKYLKLNRKAYATLYVVANGVKASIDKKTCTVSNFKENKCVGNWWLRTPGSTSYNAVYVVPEDNNAIGYMNGNGIKLDDVGVRPAMWLNY